eukprot:COSAG02_NODE_3043_length_7483_cov_14.489166_2_plen_1135_part_00
MESWTVDQTVQWVVTTLDLPADGQLASRICEEFVEDDLDGKELMHKMGGEGKRLQKLLTGVLEEDAEQATKRLLEAGAQLRSDAEHRAPAAVSPREGLTPLSVRWKAVLATTGPERQLRLQTVLDRWHPRRWVLDQQELGHGADGVVFRSMDSHVGEVAVKFSCGDEPHKLAREAALMQRVAHPHVCGLYEHHLSDDGQLFGMVLELLEKGSLQQRIKNAPDGRMREFEVVQMVFDVLSALKFMHSKHVIHRDIKPSNIMMTGVDGRVMHKLIDFSISAVERESRDEVSKTMQTGTATLQALAGTPHFMSPEQIQVGKEITPQTDLWSLGVVVFFALSGVLPFAPEESDRNKIFFSVVNEQAVQLSHAIQEVGAVSDSISEFTDRALKKGLTQRFTSAVDMTAALEEVISSSCNEQFGLFISYRVWCDKDFAEVLYTQASKLQLRPGRENRLRVYLDKVRIVDGQRFDQNFIHGLANSTVFSPLLSGSCLRGFVELGKTDKEDFVLMEWIVAIELHKRQVVKAIFPITIEMQDRGKKDGHKEGVPGLFSQSFFELLRDGKVNGRFENDKVVEGSSTDLLDLPDVVSFKSVAKARSFLRMLEPPVELSEELTVKEIVMRLLTFQAMLLHFNNGEIDALDAVKLARIDTAHGDQAKQVAQKHVAQACAERVCKIIAASRHNDQPWTTMDDGHDVELVDVDKSVEPRLWAGLQDRIAESLADFELIGVQRVQNKVLWRKYCDFKKQLAQQYGEDAVNEMELFHYAEPEVVEKVIMSRTVGFDPRLGGGEYGAGTYFAQHAIYPVAYGCGWLNGNTDQELAAAPKIDLLLAKVALGYCKDFGARCRSERGDAAANAAGAEPGLRGEWGPPVGRHGAAGFQRPPARPEAGPNELYHSVTGTEGDLLWSQNHRLKTSGHNFGRQYVSFETTQAYPELLLHLRRRPERTLQLQWEAMVESAKLVEQQNGEEDNQVRAGTCIHVDGMGEATYARMEWALFGPNKHLVQLSAGHEEEPVQLKRGAQAWHVSNLGTDYLAELATKFLGSLEPAQHATARELLPANVCQHLFLEHVLGNFGPQLPSSQPTDAVDGQFVKMMTTQLDDRTIPLLSKRLLVSSLAVLVLAPRAPHAALLTAVVRCRS